MIDKCSYIKKIMKVKKQNKKLRNILKPITKKCYFPYTKRLYKSINQ